MASSRRTIRVRVQVKQTITRRVTYRSVVQTQPTQVSYSPAAIPATSRPISRRSTVRYTPAEETFLHDVREQVEREGDRERDVFLCHAYADRAGAALELFSELKNVEVDAWFSEGEIQLGKGLMRQVDNGLRLSRVGLVLVTPALLATLRRGGVAEQELGVLLSSDRVIPIMHGVTFDDLRSESRLLAARAGLSTEGSSFAEVATKIAQSVLGVDLA